MRKYIDIDEILYDITIDNKMIFAHITVLCAGYYMHDIIFSRKMSKIISTLPTFIDNLSLINVCDIIYPYIAGCVLFYIEENIQTRVLLNIEKSITNKIIKNIFKSIETSKTEFNSNELIIHLKNIGDIKNIYITVISYAIPTLISGFVVIYHIFINDVVQGLTLICGLLLFSIMTINAEKQCIDLAEKKENELNIFYTNLEDIIINSDTIITNNTKNHEFKNINDKYIKYDNIYKKSECENTDTSFNLYVSCSAIMIFMSRIIINLFRDGKISQELTINLFYTTYIFVQYYITFVLKVKTIIHHVGKYAELKKYLKTFAMHDESPIDNLMVTNGEIVFENYQLRDKTINFKIKGNTKICIKGKNGIGKTTMLKSLIGLKMYVGNIYIDGQNIKKYSHKSLIDNIVYISQYPKLFNRTIYENLKYGTSISIDDVQKIINKYNLQKFISNFNKGLLTIVGREGNKISGGQRHIIAILRAIIQNKKIILMDEPTASLDEDLKKLFKTLINGTNATIVIITHDKSIYDIFDEFIVVGEE